MGGYHLVTDHTSGMDTEFTRNIEAVSWLYLLSGDIKLLMIEVAHQQRFSLARWPTSPQAVHFFTAGSFPPTAFAQASPSGVLSGEC
jgi:hypothetical protein